MRTICQIYLAVLSTYHIFSGIISFFFSNAAMRFYKSFYGADPIERRHLSLILKPWGALSICTGIAGWSAVRNPEEHRGIVIAILALLVLRIVYRVQWRSELHYISRISWRNNLFNILLLVVGVIILTTWFFTSGGAH